MNRLSSHRETVVRLAWAVADAGVLATAGWLAALLRYDFSIDAATGPRVLSWVLLAVVAWLLIALLTGPYLVRHVRGSFEEVVDLARASVFTALVLGLTRITVDWFDGVPRSLPISAPLFGMLGMLALRVVVRAYRWGRWQHSAGKRAVIFGAGEGGRQLVRALVRSDDSPYMPVAILDDDPGKRRLRIDGVPVRGSRDNLAEVAEKTGAETLILAMPSADSALVRETREQARSLGLELLTLPPVEAMVGQRLQGADLRKINLEDLLGRRPIELDEAAIADVISGKRVLVTGAGGSIGGELARQVARYGPAKLVLLDRDESALHSAQLALTGRALLDDGSLALADIRDPGALKRVFEQERPEIVFHAAALKHLTLLEQFPLEGYQTNVLGTANVLAASQAVGVDAFVNISTDKAANPTSVLGYTKRLAERLTAHYAGHDPYGFYVSVRFGNVLGSRGSVIPAFTAQIERGGPVTVTDPEVERYFMLIPEACQLVLQACAIGHDGQAMVLNMGHPVKIAEVARTLIDLSGRRDVDIIYTGLRPGEKKSEVLFNGAEDIQPSSHPLVSYVEVPSIAPSDLSGSADPDALRTWLRSEAAETPQSHGATQ